MCVCVRSCMGLLYVRVCLASAKSNWKSVYVIDVQLKKSNDRKNNQIFIDCKIDFQQCAIVIQLFRLLYRFNFAFIFCV